jgi:hypothetical protein
MNEGTQTTENVIYSYTTSTGMKCYTPNPNFAQSRSFTHGTNEVYMENHTISEN